MSTVARCPVCGKKRPGASRCRSCGADLFDPAVVTLFGAPPPNAPEEPGRRVEPALAPAPVPPLDAPPPSARRPHGAPSSPSQTKGALWWVGILAITIGVLIVAASLGLRLVADSVREQVREHPPVGRFSPPGASALELHDDVSPLADMAMIAGWRR